MIGRFLLRREQRRTALERRESKKTKSKKISLPYAHFSSVFSSLRSYFRRISLVFATKVSRSFPSLLLRACSATII
jgi:hypothetical protein